MRRHAAGWLGIWMLTWGSLAAAEFWEAKPFLEWSDKETQKVMADSPWAGVVTVALPAQLPVAGASGGGRGGRGGGDDMSFGPGPRRIPIRISWRTALPVRQALVRTQVGQRGEITEQLRALLSRQPDAYVVAMSGLPPQYLGGGGTIEGFLRREGKDPIPAVNAGTEKGAAGVVLLVVFPRADVIAVEDRDVEFAVKVGPLDIKKKFKLKDMMVDGRLEL